MPRTQNKPKPGPPPTPSPTATNGLVGEVLTLTEAAAYLRVPEATVVELVREQDLPSRLIGSEWRFSKSAILAWLSQPLAKTSKEGIWAMAGAWKDDPYLDDMLKEIYRQRGRSVKV